MDVPERPRVDRLLVGRVLVGLGILGAVLSVLGIVMGLRLLTGFDAALGDSIGLTAEALDVVDASVQVTQGAVDSLAEALRRTEATTREVATGIGDAGAVLDATADLTEDQLAGSLAAVEDALPALIDVAAVIDRTLSALSAVPFGPSYDPAEPFDDSLRSIQQELDGLPEALEEQAALVRDASASLVEVQRGARSIADDLGELGASLRDAAVLLEDYASTAAAAQELVDRSERDLRGELRLTRLLVVALGITMATASAAPLALGWLLLRPGTLRLD